MKLSAIRWTDSDISPPIDKVYYTVECIQHVLDLPDHKIHILGPGTIPEARKVLRRHLLLAAPAGQYGPSKEQKRAAADRAQFNKSVTHAIYGGCQVGRATMGGSN